MVILSYFLRTVLISNTCGQRNPFVDNLHPDVVSRWHIHKPRPGPWFASPESSPKKTIN